LTTRIYVHPDCNLTCAVWAAGLDPASDPATYVDVPCQVYCNSLIVDEVLSIAGDVEPAIHLRIPVDLTQTHSLGYWYEAPAGSGFLAKCASTRWVHKGLPNEYWDIICFRENHDSTPHPGLP